MAFCLAFLLIFSQADAALAARGGRIGGGSFRRMPSRSYTAPRNSQPVPGRGYGGGGFGFPFLLPIFGFGGGFGGLFSILIFIAIANFLVSAFRRSQDGDSYGYESAPANPPVSINKLQVGLLADARSLQADLNRIAETADTGSSAGLAQVVQESTLALLRHPEYWVYAGAETSQARLNAAETQFNRLALAERCKFTEETLSNVNNQLKQADRTSELPSGDRATQDPGEYIVVTLITASEGKVDLPNVNDSQELRRALSQLGAIPADNLLAVEVLWTPQAETDTLSSDDVLTSYPTLTLI